MRVCAADVLDARTLRLAIPVWLASYTVTKMGEAELPCSVCRRTCTGLMRQVRAPRSGVGGGARVAWSPTLGARRLPALRGRSEPPCHVGDYSYLEAWRAAAARMWPGEHGSRSFGECARCALAAEHGCLSPDQLHVTYWHVWASEWLIDFRLGACAGGRCSACAPSAPSRERAEGAGVRGAAHVLRSRPSLIPAAPGPRGPRTTLHALPSLRTALRSPAAH